MQCVILAAGLGTRMGELTKDIPKSLLKVGGKSILEQDLEALPDEIDEVILVIGYLGEKIRKKFGNSYRKLLSFNSSPLKRGEEGEVRGLPLRYIEQKELKGTADALWQCKDLLHGKFLVLTGDDLYDKKDLEELVKYDLAILVWELRVDQRKDDRQAVVKIDKYGNLLDIVERQPAAKGVLVNTGAYVLNAKLFNYDMVLSGIPAGEYGLPQTFLQIVTDGAKFKVIKATRWKKIVTPEDLKI